MTTNFQVKKLPLLNSPRKNLNGGKQNVKLKFKQRLKKTDQDSGSDSETSKPDSETDQKPVQNDSEKDGSDKGDSDQPHTDDPSDHSDNGED